MSTANPDPTPPDPTQSEAPNTGETSASVAVDPKTLDRHECAACGYTYNPVKGDSKSGIEPGTSFEALPDRWRCPVCGAQQRRFQNIGPAGSNAGFKQNLNYGLGVNTLSSGQKNLLIFGGLGLFFLLFLSLYTLQ
jgi:rubredoxin